MFTVNKISAECIQELRKMASFDTLAALWAHLPVSGDTPGPKSSRRQTKQADKLLTDG